MENVCKSCGVSVEEGAVLKKIVEKYKIPFVCLECGSLKFKMKAIRDIAFVLEDAPPEKVGSIFLSSKTGRRESTGTVLSCGPGYVKKETRKFIPTELKTGDRVIFDKDTPWNVDVENDEGRLIGVRYMGAGDVKCVIVDE